MQSAFQDPIDLTVLIIEDDSAVRAHFVELLESDARVGRVLEAADATAALRILNQYSGGDEAAIDLVYLDIRHPGLDGVELAQVFSSLREPPSVVFVTAHDDRAVDAYEVGAEDYLLKPIRPERLTSSLDRVIARRSYVGYIGGGERSVGKVFLCHSMGDKEQVRDLYQRLERDGFHCWLDEEDLIPGQDWDLEIQRAIRASRYVLACISSASINKRGYLQKELKVALDVADEQPEGTVFLIPVRLEKCTIPERLRRWQWVDLFAEDGYDRLIRALGRGPTRGV